MPKCVDCKHEGKYFNLPTPYPIELMLGMRLGMPGQVSVTLVGFEEEAQKRGFTREDLSRKGMYCQAPGGGPTKDPIVLVQAIGDQPCSYFSPKKSPVAPKTPDMKASAPGIPLPQPRISTDITLEEAIRKYTEKGYSLVSRQSGTATLQRKAPLNTALLVILILFFWIGALIYWASRKKYQVMLVERSDGSVAESGGTLDEFEADRAREAKSPTWGIILIVVGALAALGGLCIGLASIWGYASDPTTFENVETFITGIIFCPVPILVLGLLILAGGSYLLWRAKKTSEGIDSIPAQSVTTQASKVTEGSAPPSTTTQSKVSTNVKASDAGQEKSMESTSTGDRRESEAIEKKKEPVNLIIDKKLTFDIQAGSLKALAAYSNNPAGFLSFIKTSDYTSSVMQFFEYVDASIMERIQATLNSGTLNCKIFFEKLKEMDIKDAYEKIKTDLVQKGILDGGESLILLNTGFAGIPNSGFIMLIGVMVISDNKSTVHVVSADNIHNNKVHLNLK